MAPRGVALGTCRKDAHHQWDGNEVHLRRVPIVPATFARGYSPAMPYWPAWRRPIRPLFLDQCFRLAFVRRIITRHRFCRSRAAAPHHNLGCGKRPHGGPQSLQNDPGRSLLLSYWTGPILRGDRAANSPMLYEDASLAPFRTAGPDSNLLLCGPSSI